MANNIETINQAAQRIAEMMKEVVNQEQEENQQPVTMAQIETDMRGGMGEIECECGGKLQYQSDVRANDHKCFWGNAV